MFDDDDDDDFFLKMENMPLYKKGMEILEVVRQLVDLIPENNPRLASVKPMLLEDALLLNAKLANAEGGDLYDIRMENAALIRKAANDLMVRNHTLEMFGFEYVEYYQIVRKLIEEYRLLFIDWVAGFDKWNYSIDRWGLFNPPGVGPFDIDIDDEI